MGESFEEHSLCTLWKPGEAAQARPADIMNPNGDDLVSVLGLAPGARRERARVSAETAAVARFRPRSEAFFMPRPSRMERTMRIFSGIQPTGSKHLGNLIGGFRQYAATQEQGDGFFCVVDLHSISVAYDPGELRASTLDLAAMLFATGLDPDRSTVFAQSHVTAHAEANWLLSAVTSFGELRRMTQFKDKVEKQDFVSAALFTYPVLQAGDILLYQADVVPVGDDQRQHIELARDVAERFNSRFGETFTLPRVETPTGGRPRDGPSGAVRQDVHHRRHAAGNGADRRSARRDQEEVQIGRDRLRLGGTPRAGQARDHEPDRDHVRRSRRVARGRGGAVRRRRLRPVQGGGRRGGGRARRPDPGALPAAAGGRDRAQRRCSAIGADKAREASAPTLAAMYERMGFTR